MTGWFGHLTSSSRERKPTLENGASFGEARTEARSGAQTVTSEVATSTRHFIAHSRSLP